ncbi:hypothetical protein GDO86_009067 [Hymenochirus boettgeri]|uniref:Protein angel homolog 2 n=1 Tax=Hymenochirus boettgeri TaxID=247094 RepID=A0A8T2JJ98_9PIPI|nr:hypothetical protein GDO86_009067 [Hymenochirus boettgeri]
MLPHHLQNLNRNWASSAGHPQNWPMSRNVLRCPWWTWSPYPPVYHWGPQINWSPRHFYGPGRSSTDPLPCFPWNSQPSSWFHFYNYNMSYKRDEPLAKRIKTKEEEQSRQKRSPRTSYSPTKDLRVPPLQASPGIPHTADIQSQLGNEVKRGWEDFSSYYSEKSKWVHMHGSTAENFDFTVLSYNILSQDLLEDNSHLYSHCRRPILIWSYRLPNILKELADMNADILCLQEVQEDHYKTQIKPSLESLGYICEYKTRTGSKPDGCAICFKSLKFSLVSVTPVEYYRPNIALLDRDNIGLVLMLRPKIEREAPVICVANTHLLYNPRRGDIKLTQLAILLAEIAGLASTKEREFCPIVLCGDFNSVPGSPLHQFIKEGKLNYGGMTIGKVSGQEPYTRGQRILSIPIWPKSLGINQNCLYEPKKRTEMTEGKPNKEPTRESTEKIPMGNHERVDSRLHHHFSLSSVYSHFIPETGVPEITTCHSRASHTVDYIFYSAAINDNHSHQGTDLAGCGLQLLGRLSLLTEQDLWSINGLPNERNPSDHLPLLAKFRMEV